MKNKFKILLFSLVFIFCKPISAQTNSAALSITHLIDNFYIYVTYQPIDGSPYPANSMYLVTDKGVVLFDTPWDSTQFQPLLDSIENRHHKKVILCIATHYHADRTAGLEFYKQQNIKTYTSKLTYDLCAANNEKQSEFYFTKDSIFTVGNYTFQTYFPGAGHTKDNIVIWFPKNNILYGGCFIKSTEAKTLGYIGDANISEWSKSIKKIKKLLPNVQYVIPGHLDWTDKNSLSHTQKLVLKYRLANEK